MIIVGLTGGLGTGKTTVAKILKRLGADVIDADRLAHSSLKPGAIEYKKVISCFGTANRKKLGKIVFKDKKALQKLNKIIHPRVISIIKTRLKKVKDKVEVVVIDAPLLIEAGLKDLADRLVVVRLDRPTQIKRLIKKTGLSQEDLLRRINLQFRLKEKLKLADFIIDNNGTINQTRKQVTDLWKKLKLLGG